MDQEDFTFVLRDFYNRLLAALDAGLSGGRASQITIEEVQKHITKRDLFDYLNAEIDLGFSPPSEFDDKFQEFVDDARVQRARKAGIRNSGISLLLFRLGAYIEGR